jgi:Cu2+-exporting ATPase
MEESLTKLIELQMVARDLERNVKRSWLLILGPNLICIGGAFFGGFGVMHSMVFNQIGGLLALGNGLLPLREVAKARSRSLAKEVPVEGVPLLQFTSDPVVA